MRLATTFGDYVTRWRREAALGATMFGGADRAGAGKPSPYGGWRLWWNRFLWRTFIFTAAPAIIAIERIRPDGGYGHRLFSAGARLTNRLVGARVDLLGREKLDPAQAYVFVPNHRSHIDITALVGALPGVRFAAKRELFNEPALGAAMRALGMIPIDRSDPAAAKRALDEAGARLGRRISVVIFPEGTRAPAGRMLPFKSGAFVFAIQSQLPIVPVALHNTTNIMPAHGYLSILGGRTVVEILDPIATEGLTLEDRNRLKERAYEALMHALRRSDGGVAERPDLGSFAGHAWGIRSVPLVLARSPS